jgi:hypothetical protein
MKLSSHPLIAAVLALNFAAALPAATPASEPAVLAQDLVKVTESGAVMAALWTRRTDSYTLQIVLDRSRYVARPVPAVTQKPATVDRSVYFIGNTIANLRGLDPSFGCRTLTLIDGRRAVRGQPGSASAVVELNIAPAVQAVPTVQAVQFEAPQVQVWLLKADGTQILPVLRSPQPAARPCIAGRVMADEILYRFPVAESAQAVAAAIRIGDEYYVEKLRPLEEQPRQNSGL